MDLFPSIIKRTWPEVPISRSGREYESGEMPTADRYRVRLRHFASAAALFVACTLACAANAANAWAVATYAPVWGGQRAVNGLSSAPGGRPWEHAGTGIGTPVALVGVVLVVVVAQWFIARRDPKFVKAPARKDEDSVGFD